MPLLSCRSLDVPRAHCLASDVWAFLLGQDNVGEWGLRKKIIVSHLAVVIVCLSLCHFMPRCVSVLSLSTSCSYVVHSVRPEMLQARKPEIPLGPLSPVRWPVPSETLRRVPSSGGDLEGCKFQDMADDAPSSLAGLRDHTGFGLRLFFFCPPSYLGLPRVIFTHASFFFLLLSLWRPTCRREKHHTSAICNAICHSWFCCRSHPTDSHPLGVVVFVFIFCYFSNLLLLFDLLTLVKNLLGRVCDSVSCDSPCPPARNDAESPLVIAMFVFTCTKWTYRRLSRCR